MQANFARDRSMGKRQEVAAVQTLLGIIQGVMADGHLSDQEIHYLNAWMLEHAEFTWPVSVIRERVREVLADGVITEDEREHLMGFLAKIVGDPFSETGWAGTAPAALPIDDCVTVEIPHHTFCFTGDFVYGTRAACERLVLRDGGLPCNTVTRTLDVLVIGTIPSPEWAFGSFGRKIEAAMKNREAGHGVEIISERRWLNAHGVALN